jgi:hypothetical protein
MSENKDTWVYDRTNSHGEKKFKRYTDENLNDAVEFLEKEGVEYIVKEGATMVWIFILDKRYQYYYTTGRWGVINRNFPGLPKHHYHCRGIQDLFDRFLFDSLKIEREMKAVTNPEQCLSELVDVRDESCNEVLFSGRKIIKLMPQHIMDDFRKNNKIIHHGDGNYQVVDNLITREKAIEKYGEISSEEIGPRGGWKSVTFGTTKFTSKLLRNESQRQSS